MTEEAKRYYPAFLDLTGRLVVVVGSGPAAARKARQLVRYGADVTVIASAPDLELLQGEADGVITVEQRGYVRGDLEGATLVVCVEVDPEVRVAVGEEARARNVLANIADEPGLSSFLAPSVVHREPLQIAVSTAGVAPSVAKHIRRQLAEQFPASYGEFVALCAEVRALAHARLADPATVAAIETAMAASDLPERIAAGQTVSAQQAYDEFAAEEAAPAEEAPDEAPRDEEQ